MAKQINERQVLIIGKSCIEEDLGDYGDEVSLLVKGSIHKIEGEDNCDGTINRIFKVKQITAEKYIDKEK